MQVECFGFTSLTLRGGRGLWEDYLGIVMGLIGEHQAPMSEASFGIWVFDLSFKLETQDTQRATFPTQRSTLQNIVGMTWHHIGETDFCRHSLGFPRRTTPLLQVSKLLQAYAVKGSLSVPNFLPNISTVATITMITMPPRSLISY